MLVVASTLTSSGFSEKDGQKIDSWIESYKHHCLNGDIASYASYRDRVATPTNLPMLPNHRVYDLVVFDYKTALTVIFRQRHAWWSFHVEIAQ